MICECTNCHCFPWFWLWIYAVAAYFINLLSIRAVYRRDNANGYEWDDTDFTPLSVVFLLSPFTMPFAVAMTILHRTGTTFAGVGRFITKGIK